MVQNGRNTTAVLQLMMVMKSCSRPSCSACHLCLCRVYMCKQWWSHVVGLVIASAVSVCAGCTCASSGRSWRCSMTTRHWRPASASDRMPRSLRRRAWIAHSRCSVCSWQTAVLNHCHVSLYWLCDWQWQFEPVQDAKLCCQLCLVYVDICNGTMPLRCALLLCIRA